jgi:hypothetical protein
LANGVPASFNRASRLIGTETETEAAAGTIVGMKLGSSMHIEALLSMINTVIHWSPQALTYMHVRYIRGCLNGI